MRQLMIQTPRGSGQQVLRLARELDGTNTALLEATGPDQPLDLLIMHLSNGHVEPLLQRLEGFEDVHVSFLPQGVLEPLPDASSAGAP